MNLIDLVVFMIDIFIKNLPPKVSVDMRRQYDSLLPIFNSYIDSKSAKYTELKRDKDFDRFMLALALFYSSVVIPLREAESCFRDLKSHHEEVQSIRLSKFNFSADSANAIHRMYAEMSNILNEYRISEHLLLFSDVRDFARNLNFYLKAPYAE